MGINCPLTALAKRWGYIYRAPLICQGYVSSSIENLHFTSTDLSVGVSAGTQPPSGFIWTEQPSTTVHHQQLVDSDQGENNHPNPPNHQNQFDGQEASVTPEGSAAHAQATPLDVPPPHQPPQPEDPLVVPQVPQGAPMEVVMAALVNTINRQGHILREQADNMRGQNELIRKQNRRLRAVPKACTSTTCGETSESSPRHSSEAESLSSTKKQPRFPTEDHRLKILPPRRNNRSPPWSGEAAARGGNTRHSPRRESPDSGDERHRGPLSRRIMDIPLPRGLEKPPTLNKYDATTDPDEHVQSVETALDYRNLRGSIKCKLFPLSLFRGASTWWRNLPPGSIDSWEELCRTFTAHFTTSWRHPKTVASLKAIVQGPEESLRNYIERFNKVSVEVEATDKMKLYLLEEGLREGTKFQEAVGILEVQTLNAFFELAQRYIKYEDKQKASEVRRPKTFEVGGPSSQREERRGDEKKREGGKVREAKPPKMRESGFQNNCPQNQTWHVTDDCVHLMDAIEILIQKGYARQYVDGHPRTANNNAPRQNQLAVDPASPEQHVEEENRVIGGVALAISRPEDFLPLQTDEEKGALDYLAVHLDESWENFPGALVISEGGFNPITIGSIKRKFDELEKPSPVEEIKITEVKESSVPLAFYREEVPGGSPNFQIPLLVRAKMANFDVRRIFVDQGSSCDIMYSGLFKVLQLTEENLVPYVGSDLQGFNGSTTKPWGYVDLIVTFGENKAMKSVKVKFLVIDCPSLYNCIVGRPTLAELFAVSSTIHLKLKYYTKEGQVATINGDIEAARRCFEAASKNLDSVVMPKKKKAEAKLPGVNSISIEDGVELDARTSKKERKQEKKASKDDLLIKENYRPIPDGEFELVPLGEDPTLTEDNLVPYVGSDLQGFNGSTTKPWGYVDLVVTFGENKAMKSVKVKFLVVDCPSLYNCIIGRPTLAELFAVSSTIHLKLKYYTKDGQVATINGDIKAIRRCFEAASKNLNSVVTPKKKKAEAKLPGVNSISIEDGVELDARTSKKERKQERKASKDDLSIKENYRPIPDGEFELVPLGEDPAKGVKIGADLPDLVKRQLKACLRENAELFAWSAAEMPGIDPEVACHQLTIDPRASVVV
ncbi:hypothetical protein TSUD_147530 [Trifolium subterraneum]|uniref:Retrotransposon gag domain-containing protein n=1 Tax=Trifolium subterraneum TaxID=3900 RepID=A0A2Z6NR75_TRISU|nr:hypothetical protein TSUD_147530 [Trifolium subterraneum]